MFGISGNYRLGKNNSYFVILSPNMHAPWVYVFCLVNIWLGCWASGMVLLRLPHPLSPFHVGVLFSQFLIYPLLVSVLVKGYRLKPIVFDKEKASLFRSGKTLFAMAEIKSLEIKGDRCMLIRFKCGKRWRISHPENRDGLLDMARAVQEVVQIPLSIHQDRMPPPEGKMGWLLWI